MLKVCILFLSIASSLHYVMPDPAKCRQRQRIVWCQDRGFVDIPLDIPLQTQKLFLQDNELQFDDFPLPRAKLTELNLDGNLMRSLPTSLPTTLTTLTANVNRIVRVGVESLRSLVSLRKLSLMDNRLSEFAPLVVFGESNRTQLLGKLQTLDLSKNVLTEVPRGLPPTLEVLKLSYNRIKHLRIDSIRYLPHLKKVCLGGNIIKSVPNNFFNPHTQIKTLDLSSNLLNEIPYNLPSSLNILMLRNNSIKWISNIHNNKTGLEALKRLQNLDLAQNNLTGVEKGSLPVENQNERIMVVKLSENKWRCDCNIKYLRDWLLSNRVMTSNSKYEVVCHSPPMLAGKYLQQVPENHLICPSTSTELFSVDDVTSSHFRIAYVERNVTARQHKWLMHGSVNRAFESLVESSCDGNSKTCLEKIYRTSNLTSVLGKFGLAHQVLNDSCRVRKLTSSRAGQLVDFDGTGAAKFLLACVFEGSDELTSIQTFQNCQLVTPVKAKIDAFVVNGERERQGIANWAIVLLVVVMAVAFVVILAALAAYKLRHDDLRGGLSERKGNMFKREFQFPASKNVASCNDNFLIKPVLPACPENHPDRNGHLLQADDEFEFAVVTSSEEKYLRAEISPPYDQHRNSRSNPDRNSLNESGTTSGCYSDSNQHQLGFGEEEMAYGELNLAGNVQRNFKNVRRSREFHLVQNFD